jgi:hypothetical protein
MQLAAAPYRASGLVPVGNWMVFYSFANDHEIPLAHERPLCAQPDAPLESVHDLFRKSRQ